MDSAAMHTLYQKYSPTIITCCQSMLRDSARAEDATHDTFARFIERYSHLIHSPKAPSLLFQIARNRCRDELRASSRHAELSHLCVLQHATLQAPQDVAATLHSITMQLTPQEQDMIRMRYVDGMTLSAIAQSRRSSISEVRRNLASIGVKVSLFTALIAMLIALLLSGGSYAHTPQPAQVVEPVEDAPIDDVLFRQHIQEICTYDSWKTCAHHANVLYNKKKFKKSLLVSQWVCEHPQVTKSYRLQACQRAGLLALWHASDHELAQAMFERGCEGDASTDTVLEKSFRDVSCNKATLLTK